MEPEQLAAFALEFREVSEEQPFGPGVEVYKVAGRIFAILAPDQRPSTVALKCEPALALHLREQYAAVKPGYHLNKRHWNTVALDGSIPDEEIEDMVTHSYERVVAGMSKADRLRLLADWNSARKDAAARPGSGGTLRPPGGADIPPGI